MSFDFTPRSDYLRVRLCDPEVRTPGGIFLPDRSQENSTQGEVLAAGPGWAVAGTGSRAVMWAETGDVVLFPAHLFRPTTADGREGIVRDSDLIGLVVGGDEMAAPLGEWILVAPDRADTHTPGGLEIPDAYRYARNSGVFLNDGPGRLRVHGRFSGYRLPVYTILGLDEDRLRPGALRLYWSDDAEVIEISGEGGTSFLVKARDVVAMEES